MTSNILVLNNFLYKMILKHYNSSLYSLLYSRFILIFLLNIVLNQLSFSQNNNDFSAKVQKVIDKIAQEDIIKVYPYGALDSLYINTLKADSRENLEAFTNHKSPYVRFYAIYILTQYFNEISFFKLEIDHLNDTAKIKIMYWPYVSDGPQTSSIFKEKLNNIFIELIGSSSFGNQEIRDTYRSSPFLNRIKNEKGIRQIDSLLICTDNNLLQTKNLLLGRKPIDGCYKHIKNQVQLNNNYIALIALSKFKNEKDIPFILAHLPLLNSDEMVKYYFLPFIEFQHPEMFKFLNENFNECYKHYYYSEAILQYKNKEALDLLNIVVKQSKQNLNKKGWSFLREKIIRQLSENFISTYADLLFELLEENPNPYNIQCTDDLWIINKERTYQFVLKSLSYKTSCGNSMKSDFFVDKIRNSLKKNAPEFLNRFNKDILKIN